jgi:hypothetical protein
MTTVAILPERVGTDEITYRAVAGNRQSTGKTAGEALDALTVQLGPEESGTIFIVQNLCPDRFFTAEQQHRLAALMSRWRTARDTGTALSAEEQAELESLAEAELEATTQRAEALLNQLPV